MTHLAPLKRARSQCPCSIIIPQYGRSELTWNAVSSLQSHHENSYEILIVDDGSEEEATRNLQNLGHSQTTIIRHPRRRGVTAAWNTGAKEATGQNLIFLNNDTLTTGPWIEELLALLQCPENRIGGLRWRRRKPGGMEFRQTSSLLQGWCLAMTRDTFHALNGFDERFRLYFSDTDMQLRCLKKWPNSLAILEGAPIRHLKGKTTRHWHQRRTEWLTDRQRFHAEWGEENSKSEILRTK
ncbi:MAG TPA: glycosyltransferase [Planctomicrobium sp.]|nr:glycosyltransferase [Planctomicrobium sp.]